MDEQHNTFTNVKYVHGEILENDAILCQLQIQIRTD